MPQIIMKKTFEVNYPIPIKVEIAKDKQGIIARAFDHTKTDQCEGIESKLNFGLKSIVARRMEENQTPEAFASDLMQSIRRASNVVFSPEHESRIIDGTKTGTIELIEMLQH